MSPSRRRLSEWPSLQQLKYQTTNIQIQSWTNSTVYWDTFDYPFLCRVGSESRVLTQTFTCLHLNVLCLPVRTEFSQEAQDSLTRLQLVDTDIHMEKPLPSTSRPSVHFQQVLDFRPTQFYVQLNYVHTIQMWARVRQTGLNDPKQGSYRSEHIDSHQWCLRATEIVHLFVQWLSSPPCLSRAKGCSHSKVNVPVEVFIPTAAEFTH